MVLKDAISFVTGSNKRNMSRPIFQNESVDKIAANTYKQIRARALSDSRLPTESRI
jgi:hypothetical protein